MKKGFTLIELLGVIIILGLLVVISYPVILEQVEKKREDINQAKMELIESAIDAYIKDHMEEFPNRVGNQYCISLDDLVEEDMIAVDVSDISQRGVQVNIGSNYNNTYRLVNTCADKEIPEVTAIVNGKEATLTLKDETELAGYAVTTSTAVPETWTDISGKEVVQLWTATSGGTYYVHVKDKAGNMDYKEFKIASALFCQYSPGQVVKEFSYKGSVEEYAIPCDGVYKLEVWGAQGGSCSSYYSSGTGGLGGYAYGNKTLTKNTILYIGIGQQPSTNTKTGGYNGGGTSSAISNGIMQNESGGGGGATHIASTTNRGVLANYSSYRSEVLIVAGGGGGSFCHHNYDYGNDANVDWSYNGGTGGGTSGGAGGGSSAGSGGTQSSGASFGTGVTCTVDNSGGGGGGYYSGMCGGDLTQNSGGGGSGYLNTSQLISGTTGMQNGQRSGNGYARITLVSLSS